MPIRNIFFLAYHMPTHTISLLSFCARGGKAEVVHPERKMSITEYHYYRKCGARAGVPAPGITAGDAMRSINLALSPLRNGAIATVGATRLSWYTHGHTSFPSTATIGGVGYEYGSRLIASELGCGRALYDTKKDVNYGPNRCWQNYIVFNILGDPSVGQSPSRLRLGIPPL